MSTESSTSTTVSRYIKHVNGTAASTRPVKKVKAPPPPCTCQELRKTLEIDQDLGVVCEMCYKKAVDFDITEYHAVLESLKRSKFEKYLIGARIAFTMDALASDDARETMSNMEYMDSLKMIIGHYKLMELEKELREKASANEKSLENPGNLTKDERCTGMFISGWKNILTTYGTGYYQEDCIDSEDKEEDDED